MRAYKVKGFVRFQRRERIADAALVEAILAAERGLVDADLGGGLIKQRIARPGQGKSGGFWSLIARRPCERARLPFRGAEDGGGTGHGGELRNLLEPRLALFALGN